MLRIQNEMQRKETQGIKDQTKDMSKIIKRKKEKHDMEIMLKYMETPKLD